MIEIQLPRWIMKCSECLLIPLPFFATKIINPFLNSRITANHDKVGGLSANGEILIKGIVFLLYNLFCKAWIKPNQIILTTKEKAFTALLSHFLSLFFLLSFSISLFPAISFFIILFFFLIFLFFLFSFSFFLLSFSISLFLSISFFIIIFFFFFLPFSSLFFLFLSLSLSLFSFSSSQIYILKFKSCLTFSYFFSHLPISFSKALRSVFGSRYLFSY